MVVIHSLKHLLYNTNMVVIHSLNHLQHEQGRYPHHEASTVQEKSSLAFPLLIWYGSFKIKLFKHSLLSVQNLTKKCVKCQQYFFPQIKKCNS
jgi:hypothetical protein